MKKHRLESNSSFGIQYPFVDLIISNRTGKMNKLSEIFHAQYYYYEILVSVSEDQDWK